MTRYPLGSDFPGEAFVQQAIERHFEACKTLGHPTADLVCTDAADGATWHIEAKGQTSDVGLDFRTGLGQLVQGMSDPAVRYALAMPDTSQFASQRARVSEWVRTALNLRWILVDRPGP